MRARGRVEGAPRAVALSAAPRGPSTLNRNPKLRRHQALGVRHPFKVRAPLLRSEVKTPALQSPVSRVVLKPERASKERLVVFKTLFLKWGLKKAVLFGFPIKKEQKGALKKPIKHAFRK